MSKRYDHDEGGWIIEDLSEFAIDAVGKDNPTQRAKNEDFPRVWQALQQMPLHRQTQSLAEEVNSC